MMFQIWQPLALTVTSVRRAWNTVPEAGQAAAIPVVAARAGREAMVH